MEVIKAYLWPTRPNGAGQPPVPIIAIRPAGGLLVGVGPVGRRTDLGKVAVQITDTQQVTLRVISAVDAAGNPAELAGKVSFTSQDNFGGIEVIDNGDGTAVVKAAVAEGHLGAFVVTATDGAVTTEFDIVVVASGEVDLVAAADPAVPRQ